jgi:hypothetical protein
MLKNNFKFGLGFVLSACLSNAWCASESEFTFKPGRVGARSIAASSARTNMSRKELNLTKPIVYDGAVEELYHPLCQAIFHPKQYITAVDLKEMLSSIVVPSEINAFNPQSAERVRNVVTDAGIYILQQLLTSNNVRYLPVRTVNFINFLLMPEFTKSDFSWQDSFANAVGDGQAAAFFSLVHSNPSQVAGSESFKVWNELFFGDSGIVCRYAVKRQGETNRANTFSLFEKLFAESVNSRSIQLLKAEAAEKDKQIAAAQAESEAKIAALQRSLEEKAAADAARIASENVERDRKQRALEEKLAALEVAQQEERDRRETVSTRPAVVKLQERKQESKESRGCAIQ